MTSTTIMTREELLELAALDTYGLLDAFESELYTRSFHHAPAAVQDEVVRLQAQLATDETLLPGEDPPAELRLRVLAAVSRAIARRASELAPLATIGRRRDRLAAGVNGLVDRFSFRTTGPVWRAAAFMFCGMVVVLAYFWSAAASDNRRLTESALWGNTSAQLEQLIGPTFKEFLFNPNVTLVRLHDKHKDGSPIQAALFLDESRQTAFVVFQNLPQTKGEAEYTLTVKSDEDGEFKSVGQPFASNGPLGGQRFSLKNIAVSAASSWKITGPRGILLANL